jgi:hypothetical protein
LPVDRRRAARAAVAAIRRARAGGLPDVEKEAIAALRKVRRVKERRNMARNAASDADLDLWELLATFGREDLSASAHTLAKWLVANDASQTEGKIAIENPARNVASVKTGMAQRWIYEPSTKQVRYFSFNAPVSAPADQQCGRVAFTDIHSRERLGAFTLPGQCDSSAMTPQERALEFLLFDLAACVQPDSEMPKPPPIK